MRDFKVIADDKAHSYGVVTDDRAYAPLTGPEVKRVVEHLLFPEVGKHKGNRDELCKVCQGGGNAD